MPISINVNVEKVDKERFFKGKKGRYMDLVLFETPESEYGDYMVKQRGDKGEKMPILGNGKYFKPKDGAAAKTKSAEGESPEGAKDPW
jgi:hypothetical protein